VLRRSEVLYVVKKVNADLRRWYTARSENLLAIENVYRQPGGVKECVCVCNEKVKHIRNAFQRSLRLSSVRYRLIWCTKVLCERLRLLAHKLPTAQEPKPDINHFDRTWLPIWRFGSIWSQIHSKCLILW